MNLTRLSLGITGAVFTGFGIACLLRPKYMLAKIDVAPTSSTGITEIRAMYGGMELGFGAFFAYCAMQRGLEKPALMAQVAGLGGLAAARLWSIARDKPAAIMYPLCAAEVAATAIGVVALQQQYRSARGQK